MGNSTGSTMYMFGAVIVIYIVGMLIDQQQKETSNCRRKHQWHSQDSIPYCSRYRLHLHNLTCTENSQKKGNCRSHCSGL